SESRGGRPSAPAPPGRPAPDGAPPRRSCARRHPGLPVIDRLVAALDQRLASEDPATRELGAKALGDLGPAAGPPSERLLRLSLEDGDSGVRASAIAALRRLDASPQTMRENAVACLEHSDAAVRARAGWALGKLGQGALPALAALGEHLLSDPAVDGRFGAAWALGRIKPTDEASLELLAKGLDDPNADVRSEVARTIGRIGAPAARLAPRLERCLEDPDSLLREEASRALVSLGSPPPGGSVPDGSGELDSLPPVEELVRRLETGGDFARAEAPWLLVKHGEAASCTTGMLAVQALTDRDSDARWSALRALGRIGERSAELTLVLRQALASDRDPDVRAVAAEALAEVGEGTEATEQALRHALEDEDALVRDEAAAALAALS